jgi:lipid-binding SYLF domain-containing protein
MLAVRHAAARTEPRGGVPCRPGRHRSRGLLAGASLAGTSLRPDDDASAEIHGRRITARKIATGKTLVVPSSGRRLVNVLQKKRAAQRVEEDDEPMTQGFPHTGNPATQ